MKNTIFPVIVLLLFLFLHAAAAECLYPAVHNGQFGYIDSRGNEALPPHWENAGAFSNGYAIVGKNVPYTSGLINLQGDLCVEMTYEISYENGIYILRKDNGRKDLFGFFDPLTQTLVEPAYDFISHRKASDDASLILAMKEGRVGYLDRYTGEVAIPFCYCEPANQAQFRGTLAIVAAAAETEDGPDICFHLLTEQNETIPFPEGLQAYASHFQDISEGKLVLTDPESGLFGFGQTDGAVLCPPQFDDVYHFEEGYAAVCVDGLWGHIDASGAIAVSPQFALYWGDDAPYGYAFSNGIAVLQLIDQHIAIDYQGNILFSLHDAGSEMEIYPFQENGLAFCRVGSYYGLINREGEFVVSPIWELTEPITEKSFSSGLEAAAVNGKYGYIDCFGQVLIDYQYESAQNFSGELAAVMIDGKNAYIDRNNHIVWMETAP